MSQGGLFEGSYPEPPDVAPGAASPRGDWMGTTMATHRDGIVRGNCEGLARAIEHCVEHGPRHHAAALAIIEDGARRYGDVFLEELKRRQIDPARFL